MAKRDRIRVQVLAEDHRSYHFVRGWLEARLTKDRVEVGRVDLSPVGSGEQRVRERYPQELNARRSRPAQANEWLVVITDGDTVGLEERKRLLQREAESRGVKPPLPQPDERVILAVPCRNIESWFRWAEGDSVDETTDYKNHYRSGAKPSRLGKRAQDRCPENPDTFPGSILDVCRQLNGLDA